jgi:hypothetical protein
MLPKYAAAFAGDKVVIGPAQDWRLPASQVYLTWFGQGSYFYTCQPHAALSYIPVYPPSAAAKYFRKADTPFVFYFQNPPSTVEAALGKGLTFTFAGPAGRIAFLPLLGFRTPAAADTEKWGQEEILPEPVQKSARWWSRHLQEYPAGVSETYTSSADQGEVTISERFEYLPVAAAPDPAARIAPLPPYLSISVQSELSAEVDKALAAGHLAPVNLPWKVSYGWGAFYFSSVRHLYSAPGQTLSVLARTLAFLDARRQQRVRAYLEAERTKFRPEQMAHLPADVGARREPWTFSDSFLKTETNKLREQNFHVRTKSVPVQALYGDF